MNVVANVEGEVDWKVDWKADWKAESDMRVRGMYMLSILVELIIRR